MLGTKSEQSPSVHIPKTIQDAVNISELEALGLSKLSEQIKAYISTGSGYEYTLARNKHIFSKIFLYPKVLRDVSKIDMTTEILGTKLSMPIGVSPFSFSKLVNNDGELAVARQAAKHGVAFTASVSSSYNCCEIGEANGQGLRFVQYNFLKNPEYNLNYIKKAESAGYKAIVISVDQATVGCRDTLYRAKFSFQSDFDLGNLSLILHDIPHITKKSERIKYFDSQKDPGVTWDIIPWLKQNSKLKIILKGVQRVDDALKAAELGVDALLVSNHGGRQLDTVPSSIESLRNIRKGLPKDCPMELYVDGGFKRGSDVFKALAYGAKAVFMGRPMLLSLAAGGEEGVGRALDIMRNELEITMKLMGCRSVEEITEDFVRTKKDYT